MMEKNKLSAFFDGEKHCESAEEMNQWFDSLYDDEQNLHAWKSYELIRNVMRSAEVEVGWDISEKVSKALEFESSHQKIKQEIKQGNGAIHAARLRSNVLVKKLQEAQPKVRDALESLPNWVQQFAQIGTAAAVSVMVILGVQHYNGSEEAAQIPIQIPIVQQLPVLQTIPLSGEAKPVSLNRDNRDTLTTQDDDQLIEQRQRINELLQDFELQRRLNAMDLDKMNEETSP